MADDFVFIDNNSIRLSNLKVFAECMNEDSFLHHINRLFLEEGNSEHVLTVYIDKDFQENFLILMNLLKGNIDLIRLSSEMDRSSKQSLVINICLRNGCLSFVTKFTAYTREEAQDVIWVLKQITAFELLPKTILHSDFVFTRASKDKVAFIKQVFNLIGVKDDYNGECDGGELVHKDENYESYAKQL